MLGKQDLRDLTEGYRERKSHFFKNHCKTKEELVIEHFLENGDVLLCSSQLKLKKEKIILILTEAGVL